MDLQQLDVVSAANQGAWCELYNPKTGEPLVTVLDSNGNVLPEMPKTQEEKEELGAREIKWRIKVFGADSDAYQKMIQQRVREDAQKQASKRNRNRQPQIDFDELKREGAQSMAKTTIEWEGLVSGGKLLPFSEGSAAELYFQHPWIREQIDEFQGERSNFLA